jgi:hypothetical protein
LFDTWLAKRPDLPRLAAPATSGFYDDIFGMPRTPISEPGLDWRPSRAPVIASGFYDEEYVGGHANITLLPGYRVALVRAQEDDRQTGYRVALVQSTHRSGYRVALVRKRRKAQHHGYRQVLVRVWKAPPMESNYNPRNRF